MSYASNIKRARRTIKFFRAGVKRGPNDWCPKRVLDRFKGRKVWGKEKYR